MKANLPGETLAEFAEEKSCESRDHQVQAVVSGSGGAAGNPAVEVLPASVVLGLAGTLRVSCSESLG